MKAKEYELMVEVIERGVTYGIRRVFKHDSAPLGCEALLEKSDTIHMAVMNEICEWFDFEDTHERTEG